MPQFIQLLIIRLSIKQCRSAKSGSAEAFTNDTGSAIVLSRRSTSTALLPAIPRIIAHTTTSYGILCRAWKGPAQITLS